MGVAFGLAALGVALAALFGARRKKKRRRRRAPPAAPAVGRRPLDLSGKDLYVVWAAKTWSRAEAYAGVHEILDGLTREQVEAFLQTDLATVANIAEFLAVMRWSGVSGEDVNVLVQESLGNLVARDVYTMAAAERWLAEEDAYWNREADEGRPV